MADSWIRAAYPLHRICFSFLPHRDLFQWSLKEKKILREKHGWAILPWFLVNIIFTCLFGIISPVYLLYSDISGKTSRYNHIQLVCHWIVLMGSWMTVSLAVIHFLFRRGIMESTNQLLKFEDRYDDANLEGQNQWNLKEDLIGYMPCQAVITMALGGPFLTAFGVFENIDPMGVVVELWLPDATTRSWSLVLGSLGIRLTVQTIAMSDSLRLLSWGIINTSMLACVFPKTLNSLVLISEYSSREDILRKFQIYDQLTIISNVILPSGKWIILDLFFTGLSAGVILIWPIFKLESIRSTLLFWLIALVAFGIFLFMWVMIPCAAKGNEMANNLLERWRIEGENWRNVNRKYVRRWVRSRRLLAATCYNFFTIDNTTLPQYMNTILDNIVNALLLW
ncbi:unnamed protein product [Orchesella dallaii]|uniref:Gustatory receptor n=1 Tax=Orchesella dallaii TaxID=48710 RepID=A0ABP1RB03_9HEXA